MPIEKLGIVLVLGDWSPKNGRMMATAYAKSGSQRCRRMAGGRLLAGFLQKGQAVLKDLGEI